MYDFVIVGSGLFGSVFAHEATKKGKRCLVIEKRKHIGGNIRTESIDGITVHSHGPHIFHTKDKFIWDYVNSFVPFNNYIHTVMANNAGKLYNLPFNMNTFYQLFGTITPEQAKKAIHDSSAYTTSGDDLKSHAISQVGSKVYETLIRHYTEKQWGRRCEDLPASIIKRIPIRFNFDNNYFNDPYQGIPIGGYNRLIEGLLDGIEIRLDTDYFANPDLFKGVGKRLLYTGALDEFYNYRFGELEYRSLSFVHDSLDVENYQGCAGMKFTGPEVPYTRIIEHKHFEKTICPNTVITYEYPEAWSRGKEMYYPINDAANNNRYKMYKDLADSDLSLLIGGRCGLYRYINMDTAIKLSLRLCELI